MRTGQTKAIARAVAIMSTAIGIVFGISFIVIRSDFYQRDCHNIPAADWLYTANCVDANNGMRFTGFVTFVCLLALCWSVWRLRHA